MGSRDRKFTENFLAAEGIMDEEGLSKAIDAKTKQDFRDRHPIYARIASGWIDISLWLKTAIVSGSLLGAGIGVGMYSAPGVTVEELGNKIRSGEIPVSSEEAIQQPGETRIFSLEDGLSFGPEQTVLGNVEREGRDLSGTIWPPWYGLGLKDAAGYRAVGWYNWEAWKIDKGTDYPVKELQQFDKKINKPDQLKLKIAQIFYNGTAVKFKDQATGIAVDVYEARGVEGHTDLSPLEGTPEVYQANGEVFHMIDLGGDGLAVFRENDGSLKTLERKTRRGEDIDMVKAGRIRGRDVYVIAR